MYVFNIADADEVSRMVFKESVDKFESEGKV